MKEESKIYGVSSELLEIVNEEFEREMEKLKEKYGSSADSPCRLRDIILLRKPKETLYDKLNRDPYSIRFDIVTVLADTLSEKKNIRLEGFYDINQLDELQRASLKLQENVIESVLKRIDSEGKDKYTSTVMGK